MSPTQRAATLAVAALAVVIAVVLVLSLPGGPIGRATDATPAPTPVDSPAATPEPTDDPPATPTDDVDDEEIRAALAEIEEQVIAIRGLPAAGIGPPDLITSAQLVEELEALFDAEYPQEDRERDNFVLHAFGLLGPDEDVAELQLQLLGDQVRGFYHHKEKRMVVVSDRGLDAEAKLTYAHEYTHALQDAAFEIASLETDAVGEDDQSLARVSLLEGDATVTMFAWAFQHLSQEELMEIGAQPVPDTSGIPSWMVNQLIFPYTAGQAWAMELAGNPLNPDFTQIDSAYGDPPTSTAQIIDPQKWLDRVEPVPVELGDVPGALGDGWEEVAASPVGQATIGIMLEYFGLSAVEAAEASDGWAGDRYVVARGPDDQFALAWRSTWETEQDAADFEAAYRRAIEVIEVDAVVSRVGGRDVLVVHASNAELLRRTIQAAG
jgi:hypothetical protein